jgi:queuine tRNA-ribosyltransferase
VKSGEILGMMILSWANVAYYQSLMNGIREAIEAERFEEFRTRTRQAWQVDGTDG